MRSKSWGPMRCFKLQVRALSPLIHKRVSIIEINSCITSAYPSRSPTRTRGGLGPIWQPMYLSRKLWTPFFLDIISFILEARIATFMLIVFALDLLGELMSGMQKRSTQTNAFDLSAGAPRRFMESPENHIVNNEHSLELRVSDALVYNQDSHLSFSC